ncbi:MAG: Gfo/Idh/MocA family oxidoreductase [Candidatus Hydrogenedentes bacterium]|nr:Gfo/Idh/MocA family oxidoreductase [Candidatus Hydrogenedentota bacterium]
MSKKARIGIIGVGQIGKQHLDTYQKIENAEIVAIADIDKAEADRVGALYGIPNVYYTAKELLQRDDIEAVDVCLHNNFHMPATVAALQAGKHVYCEKPMAGAYRDAETMLKTAKELKKKLAIQLATVYSKETKAAKSLIDQGMLGKLYHARSTGHRRRGRPFVDGYGKPAFVQKNNSGGGALYDMGVYHIANMLYLLDNPEVARVSGKTYQEIAMDEGRKKSSGYNVEELGLGFVRFKGDVTLDIIEAWAIHLDKFEGSTVVGTKGGVRLDPFGYFRCADHLDLNCTTDLGGLEWRLHTVEEVGDVYDSPQHHWVAALQGRVELLPVAEIALNTMLISEAIYMSNELGREVTADEVKAASKSKANVL